MALLKFNNNYKDKELGRVVKADEEIDITLKRADEIVKKLKGNYKGYDNFDYERVDKEEGD